MDAIVLYHPKSQHGGWVEDYSRDYKNAKNKQLKLISLETVEGDDIAKLYDVTAYPAVLVKAGDGSLLKLWQGGLPMMNELDSYFQQ
jgi:hypothetical protein